MRDATGGRGVDVVLDIVGGDYLPRNIEILAVEGRLVQIGLQGGSSAQLNMASLLMKRLTITGVHAARPIGGGERRPRGSRQGERVAASRIGRRQAGDSRDVPAPVGRRGASAAGVEPAHRQDLSWSYLNCFSRAPSSPFSIGTSG